MINELSFWLIALFGVAFMILGLRRVTQYRYKQGIIVFAYGFIVDCFVVALRFGGLI